MCDDPKVDELRHQLSRAEPYRVLGQMFVSLTHDMASPVSWIVSNLEFVLDSIADTEHKLDSEILASLRDANEGAQLLLQLSRDIRSVADGDSIELRPIDVRATVEIAARLCRPLSRLNDVSLSHSLDASLQAYCNRPILIRALCNVIINSCQALQSRPSPREIQISAASKNEQIVMRIVDNGPGINAEIIDKIFEPGFSGKLDGLGIGLFTSRDSLRRTGGDLTAIPRANGAGAELLLTLAQNSAPPR